MSHTVYHSLTHLGAPARPTLAAAKAADPATALENILVIASMWKMWESWMSYDAKEEKKNSFKLDF